MGRKVRDKCCMRHSFAGTICLWNRRQLLLSGRARIFTAIGRLLRTPYLSRGWLSGNASVSSPYLWHKETDCSKLQSSACLKPIYIHFLIYLNMCIRKSIIRCAWHFLKYSFQMWYIPALTLESCRYQKLTLFALCYWLNLSLYK